MIYIPELIGEIVDRMRPYGNYDSATRSGNTYTMHAVNTLREGEWVVLLNQPDQGFPYTFPIIFTDEMDVYLDDARVQGQFQAINVTATQFSVVSLTTIVIEGSYKSLEPFYLFGHRLEIANRLLAKDKDAIYQYQKYPLVALRLPITENVDQYIHDVRLNIAILWFTDKTYTAKERYDNVIHPKLMPLYYEFFEQVDKSAGIMNMGRPVHQKVDRLFWGISESEGNTKYIFNDPLDAVEIIDLELKILDSQCN